MWLPARVYERLPQVWMLLGLFFMSLGIRMSLNKKRNNLSSKLASNQTSASYLHTLCTVFFAHAYATNPVNTFAAA